MSKNSDLQKEILINKLKNSKSQLFKVKVKKENLEKQEIILLNSIEKLKNTIENFGISTKTEDVQRTNSLEEKNLSKQEYFESLSKDDQELIIPSLLDDPNVTADDLKRLLV
jgi:hypothetical protein